jgi:hypothetical protein
MLENASEVVAKIMVFIFFQGPMHDIKKLLLSSVVDLSDFGFYLVEPILDGVELWRIGRQIENLHFTLLCQLYSLLFIMNRTVVKDQPFFPHVLLIVSLLLR